MIHLDWSRTSCKAWIQSLVHGNPGAMNPWVCFVQITHRDHTVWLTLQTCVSRTWLLTGLGKESHNHSRNDSYCKQPWKHPTVLERLGIHAVAEKHHIKILLTKIILERDFPAIRLNSGFMRFRSTSLRETITLIRVPSSVPAPWNNRYIRLWCYWVFKG